eukprot:c15163_g1_i1.p1 GENE.c15163_g1_i1~~c15163_g1_i1.p1  ORF type:complete len:280 (+),score=52.56 c15163_g1_i1:514-1353(+)
MSTPIDASLVNPDVIQKFPKHLAELTPRAGTARQVSAINTLVEISKAGSMIDRRFMGQQGVFQRCFAILEAEAEPTLLANTMTLMVVLCKGCDPNLKAMKSHPNCIDVLVQQLSNEFEGCRVSAAQLITGIISTGEAKRVAETEGCLESLVMLLSDVNLEVVDKGLTAIWFISETWEVLQILASTPHLARTVANLFLSEDLKINTKSVTILYRLARINEECCETVLAAPHVTDKAWQVAMHGGENQLSVMCCKLLVVLSKHKPVLERFSELAISTNSPK